MKLITKNLNKLAKKTLEKFTLKCLNAECKELVSYEKYPDHYQTCEYTLREAVCNGCSSIIHTTNRLKEIKEHNRDCNLKSHCKFCYNVFLYKDIITHLEHCEERETVCPYCQERLPYSKITAHWSKQCFVDYIKMKDEKILEIDVIVKDKEAKLAQLKETVVNKDRKMDELKIALNDKDKIIAEKDAKLNDAVSIIKQSYYVGDGTKINQLEKLFKLK
jgi:hypothetical protein